MLSECVTFTSTLSLEALPRPTRDEAIDASDKAEAKLLKKIQKVKSDNQYFTSEKGNTYMSYLSPYQMTAMKAVKSRDYKNEYRKYGSSMKAKKYRAELNRYNRKNGTYGNGDGKDASHQGSTIVGYENESENRSRNRPSTTNSA